MSITCPVCNRSPLLYAEKATTLYSIEAIFDDDFYDLGDAVDTFDGQIGRLWCQNCNKEIDFSEVEHLVEKINEYNSG